MNIIYHYVISASGILSTRSNGMTRRVYRPGRVCKINHNFYRKPLKAIEHKIKFTGGTK